MDADESVHRRNGSLIWKSPKSDRKPKPLAPPFMTPWSSASPLERVIVGCVELHDFNRCFPAMIQPPLVDFLVLRQPA